MATMASSPRSPMPRSPLGKAPMTLAIVPASEESYIHQTFYDFAGHANRCQECCDPLQAHLTGRQLCRRGHRYARRIATALYAEAKYRQSRSSSKKRTDGWQSINVDIPRGCEVVRSLLVAMDRGLQIEDRATDVMSPSGSAQELRSPIKPRSAVEPYYLHSFPMTQRVSQTSDEEAYTRSRVIEKVPRSSRRSQSSAPRQRRPVVGIEERERRPYGQDNHSIITEGSNDSGYDSPSAPHSPDIRRGSQFAEDMKRRSMDRPKPILKKTKSFERHYRKSSLDGPLATRTARHSGVGFNIDGEYLVPGM